MAQRFHPSHWHKLEDPRRLEELPPELVLQLLNLGGAETVVDFGAGTGMYSLPVARALPRGHLVAVDTSAELLRHLADKLGRPEHAALRDRVTLIESRDGVPLADGRADRVLAINVLHHVSDDPQTLAEMVRLLRAGGQLVVFEFGHMERPVGPPAHHVLQHHVLRALVAAMGLREIAYYEPGRLASFHVAMVGEKPAP
jgi:ubiquinone/menaquinone biosynthesis C-methylase UbiE